jgi:hypothetical protein
VSEENNNENSDEKFMLPGEVDARAFFDSASIADHLPAPIGGGLRGFLRGDKAFDDDLGIKTLFKTYYRDMEMEGGGKMRDIVLNNPEVVLATYGKRYLGRDDITYADWYGHEGAIVRRRVDAAKGRKDLRKSVKGDLMKRDVPADELTERASKTLGAELRAEDTAELLMLRESFNRLRPEAEWLRKVGVEIAEAAQDIGRLSRGVVEPWDAPVIARLNAKSDKTGRAGTATGRLGQLRRELVEVLTSMPKEDRLFIYEMAAANGEAGTVKDRQFMENASASVFRGFLDVLGFHKNFFHDFPAREKRAKGLELLDAIHIPKKPVGDAQSRHPVTAEKAVEQWWIYTNKVMAQDPAYRPLTDEEKTRFREKAAIAETEFELGKELRDFLEGKIDPVRGDNFVTDKMVFPALRMAPYMAQAAIPVAGIPLLFTSTAGMRQRELEERGVPLRESMDLAVLSAMVETPMEYVQGLVTLGAGKVPFVRKIFDIPTSTFRTWLLKSAGRGAAVLAFENATEAGQDITPFVLQHYASQLNKAIPGVKWKEAMKPYMGERVETFWTLMPMALIGFGVGTARDLSYLQNRRLLKASGMTEAAIRQIESATDTETATGLLQAFWNNPKMRDPNSAEAKAAMKELSAALEAQAASAKANGGAATVRRHGDVFEVRDHRGKMLGETPDLGAAWKLKTLYDMPDELFAGENEAGVAGSAGDAGWANNKVDPTSPLAMEWEDASGQQAEQDNATLGGIAHRFKDRNGEGGVSLRVVNWVGGGGEVAGVAGEGGNRGAETAPGEQGRQAPLAGFVGTFERAFGKRVVFFRASKDIRQNGFFMPWEANTIWVNADANAPAHAIVGHEFSHSIKTQNPKLWEKVRALVADVEAMPDSYRERRGKDYEPARIEEEWVGDVIGQHFDDPKFWGKLRDVAERRGMETEFKGLVQTVLDWLDNFVSRFRRVLNRDADATVLREAEDLRDGLAEMLVDYVQQRPEGGYPEMAGITPWNSTVLESLADDTLAEQMAAVRRQYEGTPQWMKAPNGKPTKLTEWQWVHVRTENFKKWFGDWENDPDNASKVLDENGEPKVYWHRSPNTFSTFDRAKIGTNNDAGWLGEGFYFYGGESEGWSYGTEKYAVFLNIREPYYASSEENKRLADANSPEASREFSDGVQNDGYDGVFYNGDLRDEVMVFDGNQVKSATGNSGAYDPANSNIYASTGSENEAGKPLTGRRTKGYDKRHENKKEASHTSDPLGNVRSYITGRYVSAEQALRLAERGRAWAMGVSESDAGGTGGVAGKEPPKVAKILPNGDLIGVTGKALQQTTSGGEAAVYVDEEAGVVYKVFRTGERGSAGFTFALDKEGNLSTAKSDIQELFDKVWVLNALGGTPTEVLGRTENGEIVIKQPLGDSNEYISIPKRNEANEDSQLVEIPDSVMGQDRDVFLAHLDGVDFLVGDLHEKNYLLDNFDKVRMLDLVTARITPDFYKKFPKLKAFVEANRRKARAPGPLYFSTGSQAPAGAAPAAGTLAGGKAKPGVHWGREAWNWFYEAWVDDTGAVSRLARGVESIRDAVRRLGVMVRSGQDVAVPLLEGIEEVSERVRDFLDEFRGGKLKNETRAKLKDMLARLDALAEGLGGRMRIAEKRAMEGEHTEAVMDVSRELLDARTALEQAEAGAARHMDADEHAEAVERVAAAKKRVAEALEMERELSGAWEAFGKARAGAVRTAKAGEYVKRRERMAEAGKRLAAVMNKVSAMTGREFLTTNAALEESLATAEERELFAAKAALEEAEADASNAADAALLAAAEERRAAAELRLARAETAHARLVAREAGKTVTMAEAVLKARKLAGELGAMMPAAGMVTELENEVSRLRGSAPGIVATMLQDGMVDFSGRIVGPALMEAVKGLGASGVTAFNRYLKAKRALAVWNDTKQPGRNPSVPKAEAEKTVAELESEDFLRRAKIVYAWNQGVNNYAAQASMAMALGRDKMTAVDPGFYVPLWREGNGPDGYDDVLAPDGGPTDRFGKPLTGDEAPRTLWEPLDAMMKRAEIVVRRAHERHIWEMTRDMTKANPLLSGYARKVSEEEVFKALEEAQVEEAEAKAGRNAAYSAERQAAEKLRMAKVDTAFAKQAESEADKTVLLAGDVVARARAKAWRQAGEREALFDDVVVGTDYVYAREKGEWYAIRRGLFEAMNSLHTVAGKFGTTVLAKAMRDAAKGNRFGEKLASSAIWSVEMLDTVAQASARLFRAGATGLRASFGLGTNIARDFFTLNYNTRAQGAGRVKVLANWFQTMGVLAVDALSGGQLANGALRNLPAVKMSKLYKRLGMNFAGSLTFDSKKVEVLKKKVGLGGKLMWTNARMANLQNGWEYLLGVMQFPETAARVAEMMAVRQGAGWDIDNLNREQIAELVRAGKEVTVDFTRMGSWSRVVNRYVPFFASSIGGKKSAVDAIKRDPVAWIFTRGLLASVAALANWWRNKDEDFWLEADAGERQAYDFLKWGREVFKIPRAFEVDTLFKALVVEIADAIYREEPDRLWEWLNSAFEEFTVVGSLETGVNMDALPPAGREVISQVANYDFYWKSRIVSRRQAKLDSEKQYGPYTSHLAIRLGEITGLSPRRTDHLVRGLFAGVGGDMMTLAGRGPEWDGADLPLVGGLMKEGDWEPSDFPIWGQAFMRRGGTEPSGSRTVNKLYKAFGEMIEEKDGANARGERMPDEFMRRFYGLADAIQAVEAAGEARAESNSREERYAFSETRLEIAREALWDLETDRIGQRSWYYKGEARRLQRGGNER